MKVNRSLPCFWARFRVSNADDTALVDYILFIQADVDVKMNPNEVQDTRYVTAEELKTMFANKDLKFTPWFQLICNTMLFEWWEHLDQGLEEYLGETEIRRM